jgi:hypothetical protein
MVRVLENPSVISSRSSIFITAVSTAELMASFGEEVAHSAFYIWQAQQNWDDDSCSSPIKMCVNSR